ncbi:MAG: hypothetical protein MRY83_13470, partial [Flavobacteriales bacterium]|nr:hypothetical protein [Flavobacteriales bacterium]
LGSVEQDYSSDQRIVLNILSQTTHELVSDNKTVMTTKIINDVEADTSFTNTTIGEPFTTNMTSDNEVTYRNGENSQIWDLGKLSSEEVIANIDKENKQISSSSFTSSQDGSNSYQGNTVATTGSCQVILQKAN